MESIVRPGGRRHGMDGRRPTLRVPVPSCAGPGRRSDGGSIRCPRRPARTVARRRRTARRGRRTRRRISAAPGEPRGVARDRRRMRVGAPERSESDDAGSRTGTGLDAFHGAATAVVALCRGRTSVVSVLLSGISAVAGGRHRHRAGSRTARPVGSRDLRRWRRGRAEQAPPGDRRTLSSAFAVRSCRRHHRQQPPE